MKKQYIRQILNVLTAFFLVVAAWGAGVRSFDELTVGLLGLLIVVLCRKQKLEKKK
jgi:hypothetical protein